MILLPLLAAFLGLAAPWHAGAEVAKEHRAVFELTSNDPLVWDSLLNNVENLRAALPPTAVEVVAHGKGLAMLVASSSTPVAKRLDRLAQAGVVFAACENTMKKKKVAKADLVPVATTVDAGVAELVRKQEAGWSYLRSGS